VPLAGQTFVQPPPFSEEIRERSFSPTHRIRHPALLERPDLKAAYGVAHIHRQVDSLAQEQARELLAVVHQEEVTALCPWDEHHAVIVESVDDVGPGF
jgi:hypothetical protein